MKMNADAPPEQVAQLSAETLAKIHEVAATLILHAARQVSGKERFTALADLGLEMDFRAVSALRAAIYHAVIGVQFPDNPMPYFDDPSLPEEVRYQ